MPRFPAYRSPYDDTPLTDGDAAFRGFSSRIQPTALASGFLAASENMRLEHAFAQTRKGALALCRDVHIHRPPLFLDFDLEPGVPGMGITYNAATRTATCFLAEPLNPKAERDRICFECGMRNAEFGMADASGRGGECTLPEAYLGTFDYELSADGMVVTFTPSDEAPAPPELWPDAAAFGIQPPAFYANAGPILSAVENDRVRGSCVATDLKNREMVVMALIDRAMIYRPGLPLLTIPYPPDALLDEDQDCSLAQFVNKVYLFRGLPVGASLATPDLGAGVASDAPTREALVWDMDFSHPFAKVPQGPHPAATQDGTGNPSLIRQPPAPWGVVFNRQLVLPRGRDEIILSDFGDPDTFDNLMNELRIMPGGNDWLVAAQPYQQARIIVFYRKSIHLVTLDTASLAIQAVYELTRQFGCAARCTVAACGAQILWLSDAGVQALNIGYEMNLTAAAAPLSEPVQDIIARVNWPRVERATATYYDNRYYLALPLDGALHNNAVLVYNFLNTAWESVDVYPENFDIRDFALLDHDGRHRLHAVTTYGYVFLLEEREDGVDDNPVSPNYAATHVAGMLRTRGLTAGTIEPKRFNLLQVESELEVGETFTVANITRNPDSRRDLLTFMAAKATDYTHRLHTRARGVAAQCEVRTVWGRPRIKGVMIEGAIFNQETTRRE